jgi:competence protein ComEC
LLRRFSVGQVTMTPTFSEKETSGVETVLAVLEKHEIPRRIVAAGDRFAAGNVSFEVLHPPRDLEGDEMRALRVGNENTRSLMLLMRHEGHTILLTGDLEGEGQRIATVKPIAPVDVMLAPHHGAKNANSPKGTSEKPEPGVMAVWARPKLVVSSQRVGTPTEHLHASYTGVGASVWDTPTTGAVTVRSHSTGVVVETFRGGEIRVLTRGK